MAIQNDNTILNKGDLKAYHQKILPYLGGNFMMSTNNSDYYSTEEKMIGVWKDGRPIYQKVLTSTIPASGSSTTINISSLGSKDIIDLRMLANSSNNSVQSGFWLGQVSGLRDVIIWVNATGSPDNGKIYIRNDGMTDRVGDPVDIIIQYTKTADAAGSAVTMPGAYDINFPYTWPANTEIYFGNGVYGKRTVRTTASAINTQYVIQAGVSKIVSCGGTQWRTGDGYGHPMAVFPATDAYPYFYIKGNTMSGGTGELSIWGATVVMQGWDAWVTYTK